MDKARSNDLGPTALSALTERQLRFVATIAAHWGYARLLQDALEHIPSGSTATKQLLNDVAYFGTLANHDTILELVLPINSSRPQPDRLQQMLQGAIDGGDLEGLTKIFEAYPQTHELSPAMRRGLIVAALERGDDGQLQVLLSQLYSASPMTDSDRQGILVSAVILQQASGFARVLSGQDVPQAVLLSLLEDEHHGTLLTWAEALARGEKLDNSPARDAVNTFLRACRNDVARLQELINNFPEGTLTDMQLCITAGYSIAAHAGNVEAFAILLEHLPEAFVTRPVIEYVLKAAAQLGAYGIAEDLAKFLAANRPESPAVRAADRHWKAFTGDPFWAKKDGPRRGRKLAGMPAGPVPHELLAAAPSAEQQAALGAGPSDKPTTAARKRRRPEGEEAAQRARSAPNGGSALQANGKAGPNEELLSTKAELAKIKDDLDQANEAGALKQQQLDQANKALALTQQQLDQAIEAGALTQQRLDQVTLELAAGRENGARTAAY